MRSNVNWPSTKSADIFDRFWSISFLQLIKHRNRCSLITFMRWVLPFCSWNAVSCISEPKKPVRKKTRCVLRYTIQTAEKSKWLPSFLNFVFEEILKLLCLAILIQARRIVNGFWFPNGTTWGKSTIIIFYLSRKKLNEEHFFLSNPSMSTFHNFTITLYQSHLQAYY